MNLSEKRNVDRILKEKGFTFKKSLGQNFLTDGSICPKMAEAAADKNTGVIEIGPGAGVLTRELSEVAGKVIAIEIDERLRPVLSETLADLENVSVIFGDVMKTDLKALIKKEFEGFDRVTVCANLPYYITSPIIMGLLESRLPVESITVMVQKEAAERLCAEVGTRAAGAVTAAVRYYAEPELLFEVPRECFLPQPNVDSAVIKLTVLSSPPIEVKDEKFFFCMIKACFAQRRKTLLNTLSNTMGIDKQVLRNAAAELGLDENVRGEALSLFELAKLSDLLCE